MPDINPGKDVWFKMDNESDWAGARDASSAEFLNTSAAAAQIKIAANSRGNAYDVYRESGSGSDR